MRRPAASSRDAVTLFVTRLLRAIAGAPDYERYLAHMARVHPERTALSLRDFQDEHLRARYERPGSRCC